MSISKHSPHRGALNDTNRGSLRLTVEEIRAVKVTSFSVAGIGNTLKKLHFNFCSKSALCQPKNIFIAQDRPWNGTYMGKLSAI